MSKNQKKNKKFEVKASDTHPSLPKAPKKKKNKKVYFDMDVQDAIVRYNDLDPEKNQSARNKIYSEEHIVHKKSSDKDVKNMKKKFDELFA